MPDLTFHSIKKRRIKLRALVIYDSTGKIYTILYGEETVPQGLTCMFVDVPEGAQLERIDVTAPDNPQPVFSYLPESDIGRLKHKVAELTEDLTTTQLALTELFETMGGGVE